MREIREVVLVGMILLLGAGCTTRPAEQASVTGTGEASGTAFQGGPLAPSHSGKLITAMAPPDAAVAALKVLKEKFGLQIGTGGNWYPDVGEPSTYGDRFSANAQAKTTNGGSIQMAFEWMKEGETEVTLTSDLPDVQYEAAVAVIRSAIGATDKK